MHTMRLYHQPSTHRTFDFESISRSLCFIDSRADSTGLVVVLHTQPQVLLGPGIKQFVIEIRHFLINDVLCDCNNLVMEFRNKSIANRVVSSDDWLVCRANQVMPAKHSNVIMPAHKVIGFFLINSLETERAIVFINLV